MNIRQDYEEYAERAQKHGVRVMDYKEFVRFELDIHDRYSKAHGNGVDHYKKMLVDDMEILDKIQRELDAYESEMIRLDRGESPEYPDLVRETYEIHVEQARKNRISREMDYPEFVRYFAKLTRQSLERQTERVEMIKRYIEQERFMLEQRRWKLELYQKEAARLGLDEERRRRA